MSEQTLRRTERDLFAAAAEIREADIPEAREEKSEFEATLREDYDDPSNVTQREQAKFEEYKSQIEDLAKTAETYEHYAEEWSADGEECVFVLEEFNGDEWAATGDAVNEQAVTRESMPANFGKVKALEYSVEEVPDGAPADPGLWPAPIVNELFEALNNIGAPSGVDLGNESLSGVFGDSTSPPPTQTLSPSDIASTDGGTAPDGQ